MQHTENKYPILSTNHQYLFARLYRVTTQPYTARSIHTSDAGSRGAEGAAAPPIGEGL